MKLPRRQRFWLVTGGITVTLLAAAVFTLGSLNLPVRPQGRSIVVVVALNAFIVAALLVFGLVLTRTILRLWVERRAGQLGSRFKTRMVFGALAISLLPVVFLFFVSYALMNRTLNKWFPRPLEIAAAETRRLLEEQIHIEQQGLDALARQAALAPDRRAAVQQALAAGADAAWVAAGDQVQMLRTRPGLPPRLPAPATEPLPATATFWRAGPVELLVGTAKCTDGATLFVARRLPPALSTRWQRVLAETASYNEQQHELRLYKNQILLTLLLVTILLLFSTTWVALFLAKTVTVPIQALAEATREISRGNFAHRVTVQAQDELGVLVRSFNRMTEQLGQSRRQLEASKQSLERALEEIERRRRLLTTLLESLPTGVLLLDETGHIVQSNPAVERLFGSQASHARHLSALVGADLAEKILWLAHRARPQEAVSQEFELTVGARQMHAAITAARIEAVHGEGGFAVVIDDLTELLRAQRASAWQEVAQRIAHEIKNPLTPIRLSAERLMRHAHRQCSEASSLAAIALECGRLIVREVATLKALVDEFSQFARFPVAQLAPTDINTVVREALELFRDRLDGVQLHTCLETASPPVAADPELLRRVLVNLIENAFEAMEYSTRRELRIETRLDRPAGVVEIAVSDTGHGIAPADKDRLFLPHFSTRPHGTGLGLAIASRIVSEHRGSIHVEDNVPQGARFIVRLPVCTPELQRAEQ